MDKIKKTIKTYEQIANSYEERYKDINLIKHLIDFFIQNLKGKKVLDIGCGPGRDAEYLSKYGLNVKGIDLTPSFIQMASKNVPKAKFILMYMRKLEFSRNSFDGIWACASFLHIPKAEAKKTLLGFRKVLKPEGILGISVKEGLGEKFKEYKDKKRFISFYTQKEFKNLVESCNFKIIKTGKEKKEDTWLHVFATKD